MNSQSQQNMIGYLLMRDGHTVQIVDLHPDEIKKSLKQVLKYGEIPLKRTTALTATVKVLGFKGDFGDYKNKHWPKVRDFLESLGLTERVDLFEPKSAPYLGFGSLTGQSRRAFADRLFAVEQAESRRPTKVFTGYDFDWSEFDPLWKFVAHPSRSPDGFVPQDLDTAREWLYNRTSMLIGHRSYFSDHLLDVELPQAYIPMLYGGHDHPEISARQVEQTLETLEVLRWFLDQREDGWVKVHLLTPNLAVLEGPNGAYDFVWKNMRVSEPPRFHKGQLGSDVHFRKEYYYMQDRCEERDQHDSEHFYYDNGGEIADYLGPDRILREYLVAKGFYSEPRVSDLPELPVETHKYRVGSSATVLGKLFDHKVSV